MRFQHLFIFGMFMLGMTTIAMSSEMQEVEWLDESPVVEFQTDALSTMVMSTECPVGSGEYCDDKYPVCCLVSGEYGCYKKLSDCKEN